MNETVCVVREQNLTSWAPPRLRDKRSRVRVNRDFIFSRDGYHVRVANGTDFLQTQVSQLINNMYGARGFDTQQVVMRAQRPGETTLVACSEDRVFGTLTLGVDTGSGLLADTLYRTEIDKYRAAGGRVCEVTKLAMDPSLGTQDVMATIFNLAFVLARNAQRMTDSFIEVHPRHTGFYRRMLGYEIAGPERTCPRVGAPAVLMRLCLKSAETRIGKPTERRDRSLYRFFLPPAEQASVVARMLAPEFELIPA